MTQNLNSSREPTLADLGLDDDKPIKDPLGKALQGYDHRDELAPTWVDNVAPLSTSRPQSRRSAIPFVVGIFAAMLSLALILIAVSSLSPKPNEATANSSAELLESRLVLFRNAANGKMGQEVLATWKNNGTTPVRVVDAQITSINDDGTTRDTFNFTLYAEFDNRPGVAPGATYTTEPGRGFKLPGFDGLAGYSPVASIRVRITKVAIHSGM